MAAISNTDAIAAVAAILLAGAVFIGSIFGFRDAFTYALGNSSLDIRILGLTVRRVPLSDISHVEVVPFTALIPFCRSFRWDAFFSWKWCGYNKRVVAIKRRTGLVNGIIVSPRDPEAFANSLRAAFGGTTTGGRSMAR